MKKTAAFLLFPSVFLLFQLSAFGAENSVDTEKQVEVKMQKIMMRTRELEREVIMLQNQLTDLKKQKSQYNVQGQSKKPVLTKKAAATRTKANTQTQISQQSQQLKDIHPDQSFDPYNLRPRPTEELVGSHYYDGAPVVISSFIGWRSDFDTNDLVVNISDNNTDLRLLKQRQRLVNMLRDIGVEPANHPILELSGQVEAQAWGLKPYKGGDDGDINVSSAELDVAAEINRWATGFVSIDFDNSATSPERNSNSRFYMKRGFITIGNLNRSPVYASFGQMFSPFGVYNSNMLSSPLTKIIGNVWERIALVGYQQLGEQGRGWNGQIYAFKGDVTNIHGPETGASFQNVIDTDSGVHVEWGGGVISNIAESTGFQNTGTSSGFEGFSDTSATERLAHRVPGADINLKVTYDKYILQTEFLSATRRFDEQDLTFNNKGAKPNAFNIEAGYNFPLLGYDSSFTLGYGHAGQALALNVPKDRYYATLNTSWWKGTIESLEFRHDVNYSSHDSASGRAGSTGALAAVSPTDLGRSSDMLTAQIGIYF